MAVLKCTLKMKGDDDSRMLVNSGYDQFTYQWAYESDYIPRPGASRDPSAGDFLPWRLALSRPLFLPQTEEKIPFDDVEVGRMTEGITDPSSPRFDNLADWHAEGDVLEVRIPWILLGFTDPSSLRVWDYPFEAEGLRSVEVPGLRIYPSLHPAGETDVEEVQRLDYFWSTWEQPAFHERKKRASTPCAKPTPAASPSRNREDRKWPRIGRHQISGRSCDEATRGGLSPSQELAFHIKPRYQA